MSESSKPPPIKDETHAHHRGRLRSEFAAGGLDGFNDIRVLELLLTYAIPRVDTNPAAHALMARFGSLHNVFDATPQALEDVDGIGSTSALFIKLIGDIYPRLSKDKLLNVPLDTPFKSSQYCKALLKGCHLETVFVISLDKKRYLIHSDLISVGTINESVIYPRTVAEIALRHKAHGVLLTHNHPSGDINPSRSDTAMTFSVMESLKTLGIILVDHVIISGDKFYSFKLNADKAWATSMGSQAQRVADIAFDEEDI